MRDDGAPQRTLHCAACRIVQRSSAPRLSHSCRWLTKNNYGHRQVAVGLTAPIAVNGLSWNQWYRAPAFGEHRLLSAELVVSPKRACGRLHTFDESRRQWRSDDLRFIATVLRRRSGTNYIEYLSGNCDCLQGVCVRGFIEIGGVPAFDCPARQLGKFDCGEGSPLVVGQPLCQSVEVVQLGRIYIAQDQQGLQRLLCCLVRPYAGAARNDVGVRGRVLGEGEVFVGPAQPPLSDAGAVRRREGFSLRALQRERLRERLLLRRGVPGQPP